MTISSKIAECVEIDYLTGKAKIKENTDEKTRAIIGEINDSYKKNMGEYLWNFEKGEQ